MQVTMKRQELIDKLSLVAPALAPNNLMPIFMKFLFDGETVAA